MDHTVIDAGHHRLLIGTIPVAPANYRYPGDPVGSAHPANGRNRRAPSIAVGPAEGPLTERTAGVQPARREQVFMLVCDLEPLRRRELSGNPAIGRSGFV